MALIYWKNSPKMLFHCVSREKILGIFWQSCPRVSHLLRHFESGREKKKRPGEG